MATDNIPTALLLIATVYFSLVYGWNVWYLGLILTAILCWQYPSESKLIKKYYEKRIEYLQSKIRYYERKA